MPKKEINSVFVQARAFIFPQISAPVKAFFSCYLGRRGPGPGNEICQQRRREVGIP